jgi:membrane associated rhomboid family serine protease
MLPLFDDVPSRRAPLATGALIALNVLAFLFELALPDDALDALVHLHGVVPARWSDPDWAASAGYPPAGWTPFLTSQFLHGGWLHLVANLWTLWLFGDNVEDRMGRPRFVLFYLACGVAAGLAHAAAAAGSTVPAIGASGAIAGVLGAYLVLFPRARLVMLLPILFYPLFFEIPAVLYLGFWFFGQVASGAASLGGAEDAAGGVAWWAHVGGFVAGLATCWLFLDRRWRRVREDGLDGRVVWERLERG